MAIRLVFLAGGRSLFMIVVRNRDIFYNDVTNGVQQLYPNQSAKALSLFGPPTPEEIEEYNMCKTEDELAAFCIRDAKKSHAKLIKKETVK
jgi:hypothetical protein